MVLGIHPATFCLLGLWIVDQVHNDKGAGSKGQRSTRDAISRVSNYGLFAKNHLSGQPS